MSKTAKMQTLRDAMVTVLPGAVYHYIAASKHPDTYIVWAEEESQDLKAGNRTIEDGVSGTVDLYTKTEYSPLIDSIEQALQGIRAAYDLNSVQYETETGYIHYEWTWGL